MCHLPDDINDHGLLQLFASYGAISGRVMLSDDGRSRGFGFVTFNSKEEAQIACDIMNGHVLNQDQGARIRVSLH